MCIATLKLSYNAGSQNRMLNEVLFKKVKRKAIPVTGLGDL
jgi:hypothetical protein